jgi:peptide/nickel transport system permease protein
MPSSLKFSARRLSRAGSGSVVVLLLGGALAASFVAPNDAAEQFRDHLFAPPMRLRIQDDDGVLRRPFVYAQRLVDRLERRYEDDRSRPLALEWFADGKLIRTTDGTPIFLLGTDSLGRDVFSRLITGARLSLGIAILSALGALLIGAFIGAVAGLAGGLVDDGLMRIADFVLVLPTLYVLLALRAMLPLVLPTTVLIIVMVVMLSLMGWPYVARGVRAIVAAERSREYAEAARSMGAGPARLLFGHLLPAARGFLVAQTTLLVPAFVLAEATLSYTGLGFAEPAASWGSMLREVANVSVPLDFPWLLAPAVAMVAFVMALNALTRPAGAADALTLALGPVRRTDLPDRHT